MGTTVFAILTVICLVVVVVDLLVRRHRNKKPLPQWKWMEPLEPVFKEHTTVSCKSPGLEGGSPTATEPATDKYAELHELFKNIPPARKKGDIVSMEEINAAMDRLQNPYVGKCGCRSVRMGRMGDWKDIVVRCERCGQPFQFS